MKLANLKKLSKAFYNYNNKTNVLFLTADNEFSWVMYSLFGGRQNIFLTVFSTKFFVKCAAKF